VTQEDWSETMPRSMDPLPPGLIGGGSKPPEPQPRAPPRLLQDGGPFEDGGFIGGPHSHGWRDWPGWNCWNGFPHGIVWGQSGWWPHTHGGKGGPAPSWVPPSQPEQQGEDEACQGASGSTSCRKKPNKAASTKATLEARIVSALSGKGPHAENHKSELNEILQMTLGRPVFKDDVRFEVCERGMKTISLFVQAFDIALEETFVGSTNSPIALKENKQRIAGSGLKHLLAKLMSGDIRIGDRTVETNVAVDSAVLVDPKGYLTAALRKFLRRPATKDDLVYSFAGHEGVLTVPAMVPPLRVAIQLRPEHLGPTGALTKNSRKELERQLATMLLQSLPGQAPMVPERGHTAEYAAALAAAEAAASASSSGSSLVPVASGSGPAPGTPPDCEVLGTAPKEAPSRSGPFHVVGDTGRALAAAGLMPVPAIAPATILTSPVPPAPPEREVPVASRSIMELMTWCNERDVKPSEEVVDSDAGKRWTATLTVPASRQATAMLTGVGFGTSSAEAREAAALELMGKLEAAGLHDPEAVAAKRRRLEESLDSPAFAKTGQISGIQAHEEWRRLVASLPPGNTTEKVSVPPPF